MSPKKEKQILVFNAGSTGLKFKLFTAELTLMLSGQIEKIGQRDAFFKTRLGNTEETFTAGYPDHAAAVKAVFGYFEKSGLALENIVSVGHRVVHGGELFTRPTVMTPEKLRWLKKFNKLAPLHNPHNIRVLELAGEFLPWAKQTAVFDTAFHATMPDFAYLYPLPYAVYQRYRIRKYGFHGISHQFVSETAGKLLKKKHPNLITCHLGGGCSVTAILAGRSVDTSMGFTPLEGLMMMTRSGDIDPSIPLFLHEQGLGSERIRRLLNFESGLSGISGLKDMRDIMMANGYLIPGYRTKKLNAEHRRLARLALEMFVYRVRKYLGAYAAVLGKVDAVVFTGGIGERNEDIRRLITENLSFKTRVLVIPTDEELQIAKVISAKT